MSISKLLLIVFILVLLALLSLRVILLTKINTKLQTQISSPPPTQLPNRQSTQDLKLESCKDSGFINNIHPQVEINKIFGSLTAHCDRITFEESRLGGKIRDIYKPPKGCLIKSSVLSPNQKILAFYVGSDFSAPNEEDKCKEWGLNFLNLESEKIFKGPIFSSFKTTLIPTFWSTDSQKIYCVAERPWGEGCQSYEVATVDGNETLRTPLCGEIFRSEKKPDEVIYLSSTKDAPAPCYGVQITNQISIFNAKTGENKVIFELKTGVDLRIIEVFGKNRYILIERQFIQMNKKEDICVSSEESYSIFDTFSGVLKNL